ncbi:sigma-54 interaction domain-containing protein [Vibrio sp. EA2]|uniref:sigma-54 interaction domain-containing protein n=1 Tax=Vibrio sp. EA2 TaxID=3079860 RepID=UPI0029491504|nr:sigma 54-interacting transcriptional regulator [Vibrio sp. EA2]MDV6254008.1 sigma 54-interacting transcriptional regulator [Vibrio sp. EA2]
MTIIRQLGDGTVMEKHPAEILSFINQVMTVFDSIASSYIIIDASETVVAYNEVSSKLDGIAVGKVLNRKLLDVFPSLSRHSSSMLQVLRNRVPIWNKAQSYQAPSGKVMTMTASTFPILDIDNTTIFVIEVVHDISNLRELTDHVIHLTETLKESQPPTKKSLQIVTENKQFKRLLKDVKTFAQTQLPVLIAGETGTGKELVARYIHLNSSHNNVAMVTINCGAIPPTLIESTLFGTVKGAFSGAENKKGLLELADGGTLFLDEINSMPIEVQSKLLRVVQDGAFRPVGGNHEKTVSIRYIAAMNEQPEVAIQKKELRSDLFYRLGVCMVVLPPLQQRLDDIPHLVECFIRKHNPLLNTAITGYTPDFIQSLESRPWPGNVRMLENVVLRCMLMCSQLSDGVLNALHLGSIQEPSISIEPVPAYQEWIPADSREPEESLAEHLAGYEKKLLINALTRCKGNHSEVARQLKLPRTTLQSKLRKYGIST